jgi:hypothetical protein
MINDCVFFSQYHFRLFISNMERWRITESGACLVMFMMLQNPARAEVKRLMERLSISGRMELLRQMAKRYFDVVGAGSAAPSDAGGSGATASAPAYNR